MFADNINWYQQMMIYAPEEFTPFLQKESHLQYQPILASVMSSLNGNRPNPSRLSRVFFSSLSSIKKDVLGDDSNPVFSVVSSNLLKMCE